MRDRVTLGYASCFGPPAAHLALARRGLLTIARLRRAFPTNSPVGLLIAGLIVFKKNPGYRLRLRAAVPGLGLELDPDGAQYS